VSPSPPGRPTTARRLAVCCVLVAIFDIWSLFLFATTPSLMSHQNLYDIKNDALAPHFDGSFFPRCFTLHAASIMNFFFITASIIGAEAFAPATNQARLSSTSLNNYGRSKWSPGSAAPASTGFSPFSLVASAGGATASVASPSNYARSKWSPNSTAPSTSNPFSSFPSSAGASKASAASSSVPYDDIRAELKSMMDVSAFCTLLVLCSSCCNHATTMSIYSLVIFPKQLTS
jgi:hypothetical protein